MRKRHGLGFKIKEIDTLRQTLLSEKQDYRMLEVTYLFGASGTGKTRSIYKNHDKRDICRITNYRHGRGVYFDDYHGQDVLVFEEFNSQIEIEEMLNYLDIYPLSLPARYSDRIACYTIVYLTSNVPLASQYTFVQINNPKTWEAFIRRIHRIIEFKQGRLNHRTQRKKTRRKKMNTKKTLSQTLEIAINQPFRKWKVAIVIIIAVVLTILNFNLHNIIRFEKNRNS